MGEPAEMTLHRGGAEGDGSRIGFVADEKIDDGGDVETGEISSAIGQRAVGNFEKGIEKILPRGETGGQESCG